MKQQQQETACPVEVALSIVGGKWKLQIVYCLLNGTKRFGELRRLIPAAMEASMRLRRLSMGVVLPRGVSAI